MIYYVAHSLGATVRGCAVLKELGEGILSTSFPRIPKLEGVAWNQVRLPLTTEADTLIIDGALYKVPDRKGRHVLVWTFGRKPPEGFDQYIFPFRDEPILPRRPDQLNLERAEEWWQTPQCRRTKIQGVWMDEYLPIPSTRHLIVGNSRGQEDIARSISYEDEFYWPAMELMSLADSVRGGQQSDAEFRAAIQKRDAAGAQIAADIICSM